MKKLLLIFCLIAFGMSAQTTQTINSQLKLATVPEGVGSDSILVRGVDKIVKTVKKSDLLSGLATDANVVHKTGNESIAGNKNFSNDVFMRTSYNSGINFGNTLTTIYGPMYDNDMIETSGFLTLKPWAFGWSSLFSFGIGGFRFNAQNTTTGHPNYSADILAEDFTTNRYYNLPNQNGTFALSEYTVGDFINDGATTMAPSQNAVFDALVLKANLASPTFTGTVTLPSTTSIGTITNTELSYVDGVTSSIQSQLNNTVRKTGVDYIQGNKILQNGVIVFPDTGAGYDGGAMLLIENNAASPNDYLFVSKSEALEGDNFGTASVNINAEVGFVAHVTNTTFTANTGLSVGHESLMLYNSPAHSNGVNLSTNGLTTNHFVEFINADGKLPLIRASAPVSSTAIGQKGEIYVDADYIYYCYGTNLWRRVAGSTF